MMINYINLLVLPPSMVEQVAEVRSIDQIAESARPNLNEFDEFRRTPPSEAAEDVRNLLKEIERGFYSGQGHDIPPDKSETRHSAPKHSYDWDVYLYHRPDGAIELVTNADFRDGRYVLGFVQRILGHEYDLIACHLNGGSREEFVAHCEAHAGHTLSNYSSVVQFLEQMQKTIAAEHYYRRN